MAMNKCIKLFLILVFVGAVAFGVTFLPFNLSDKFKAVVDKVSSHLRGLGGAGSGEKVRLDFSKRDSYTHGNLNVVLDKVDNVPKDGYLKFVHKGEKDLPLDVEGFSLGETTLEGVEPGLLDYAAGYFKGESPHLLLVELCLHNKGDGDNASGEGNKEETKKGEKDPKGTEGGKENGPGDKTEGEKVFYCPGQDNKWVKLPADADLGAKVDEVFATFTANNPSAETPEGGVLPTPVVLPTPLPPKPDLDLPDGESPVPHPQNYPLTGQGAPNAGTPTGTTGLGGTSGTETPTDPGATGGTPGSEPGSNGTTGGGAQGVVSTQPNTVTAQGTTPPKPTEGTAQTTETTTGNQSTGSNSGGSNTGTTNQANVQNGGQGAGSGESGNSSSSTSGNHS